MDVVRYSQQQKREIWARSPNYNELVNQGFHKNQYAQHIIR